MASSNTTAPELTGEQVPSVLLRPSACACWLGYAKGVLRSTRRPVVLSIRSTRSRTWPSSRIVVVSSERPRRATNTQPGSLIRFWRPGVVRPSQHSDGLRRRQPRALVLACQHHADELTTSTSSTKSGDVTDAEVAQPT